jgi:hypothetical protein
MVMKRTKKGDEVNITNNILNNEDMDITEDTSKFPEYTEEEVFSTWDEARYKLATSNEQQTNIEKTTNIVKPLVLRELLIKKNVSNSTTNNIQLALLSFTELITQILGKEVVECLMRQKGINTLRDVFETSTPTTQCDNIIGKFVTGETLCWICDTPIEKKGKGKESKYLLDPECEHVFPIAQALVFTGLYSNEVYDDLKGETLGNKSKQDIYKEELKKEYFWAHRICNQVKNDTHFVDIDEKGKFYISGDKITNFLNQLYTSTSFGGGNNLCKYIGNYYIKKGSNPKNKPAQKLGEEKLLQRLEPIRKICDNIIKKLDELGISPQDHIDATVLHVQEYVAKYPDCVDRQIIPNTAPTVSQNTSDVTKYVISDEVIDYYLNKEKVVIFGSSTPELEKRLRLVITTPQDRVQIKNKILDIEQLYKEVIKRKVKTLLNDIKTKVNETNTKPERKINLFQLTVAECIFNLMYNNYNYEVISYIIDVLKLDQRLKQAYERFFRESNIIETKKQERNDTWIGLINLGLGLGNEKNDKNVILNSINTNLNRDDFKYQEKELIDYMKPTNDAITEKDKKDAKNLPENIETPIQQIVENKQLPEPEIVPEEDKIKTSQDLQKRISAKDIIASDDEDNNNNITTTNTNNILTPGLPRLPTTPQTPGLRRLETINTPLSISRKRRSFGDNDITQEVEEPSSKRISSNSSNTNNNINNDDDVNMITTTNSRNMDITEGGRKPLYNGGFNGNGKPKLKNV